MLRIEPVSLADRDRALRLLVGGGANVHPGRSAAAFSALLSGRDARRCNFWWAGDRREPQVAAMTVRSPGRTAMIFYSPPARPGDVDALAALLDKLTEATITKKVTFVQALLPVGAETDAAAFARAGYTHLSQLIYMQQALAPQRGVAGQADAPGEAEAELEWVSFSPGREDELAEIISDTYVDTLDCPGLLGLRRIEDVIAGHKAAGIFRPENWWLPRCEGECVGCVLVNDSVSRDGTADMVYLGVRPTWRGRGFAQAMIRHVLTRAMLQGMKKMTLAVDAANTPAVRLYRQEGFHQTDRREVFIRPAKSNRRLGRSEA